MATDNTTSLFDVFKNGLTSLVDAGVQHLTSSGQASSVPQPVQSSTVGASFFNSPLALAGVGIIVALVLLKAVK